MRIKHDKTKFSKYLITLPFLTPPQKYPKWESDKNQTRPEGTDQNSARERCTCSLAALISSSRSISCSLSAWTSAKCLISLACDSAKKRLVPFYIALVWQVEKFQRRRCRTLCVTSLGQRRDLTVRTWCHTFTATNVQLLCTSTAPANATLFF